MSGITPVMLEEDRRRLINLLINDELRFIESALRIRTELGDIVKFRLNPIQRKIYGEIVESRKRKEPVRFIILKARRHGVSTLIQAVMFCSWLRSLYEKHILHEVIVAHKQDSTDYLYNMTKLFYNTLPPYFKPELRYSNKKELVMGGIGSSILVASAEGRGVGVGGGFSMLHLSEFARYDDAEDFMGGIQPTIAHNDPKSMVIIESTAYGCGGMFHKMWLNAVAGKTNYKPLFFPWFEHPGYKRPIPKGFSLSKPEEVMKKKYSLSDEQITWYRYILQNDCQGDEGQMHESYPSCPEEAFLESGRPVFHIPTLNEMLRVAPDKPLHTGELISDNEFVEFREYSAGNLKIFKLPDEGRHFVVAADIAECGTDKSDYCAAQVLDRETMEQAAVLHARIPPEEFVYELFHLAHFYNKALLAPECNSIGLAVAENLYYKMKYPNMYVFERWDNTDRMVSHKIGWYTDRKTKAEMILITNTAIRENKLKIYDRETIKELLGFKRDEKGNVLSTSKNDDLAMALCIAAILAYRYPVIKNKHQTHRTANKVYAR